MDSIPDIIPRFDVELVTRSPVPIGLPYAEYRQYLRYDFFHSCAYCTMAESEASGIRFTIDHYEPRSKFPKLENEYSNLMYSCDECNIRKGDRAPTKGMRDSGIRFFRPDVDAYAESFQRAGLLLSGLTAIAEYTIDAVDLNRLNLRRLREIRMRLADCEQLISLGIRGLRTVRIDRMPREVRKTVQDALAKFEESATAIAAAIEEVLRRHARSPYLDEDPDREAARRDRLKKLRGTEARFAKAIRE